jgi:hypothetical protein
MTIRSLPAIALATALVLAPRGAGAQEGDPSPPPPDSSATEEPRSLEPPPAAPAPAAQPGANPFVSGPPAFTWGDSTGLVLPPLADVRPRSELELDVQVSRTLRSSAETRMLKARERTLSWKSQVETQKAKIKALDTQIAAAKKEKRDTDRKEYEAQKKREQKVREYQEAMGAALTAEADAHKAAYDYAQARITEVEVEMKLGSLWGSGGYEKRVSNESRELERQVLLAVKERGERMATYAQREQAAAERRLGALKLWNELQK